MYFIHPRVNIREEERRERPELLGCGFDRLKKRSEERRLEIPVSNLIGVHLRENPVIWREGESLRQVYDYWQDQPGTCEMSERPPSEVPLDSLRRRLPPHKLNRESSTNRQQRKTHHRTQTTPLAESQSTATAQTLLQPFMWVTLPTHSLSCMNYSHCQEPPGGITINKAPPSPLPLSPPHTQAP